MEQEQKTNSMVKTFLGVFVTIIVSTFLIYWLLGFEISLLFCISAATALISMAFTGLENTIISKK